MADATHSIAIPLATNLHLAFDTRLLRTHTVWRGPSLNLFGPPYHGAKSPFICTFDGVPLWTMPQFSTWQTEAPSTNALRSLPPGSQFKGLSTQGGRVALKYQIGTGRGAVAEVRETPKRILTGDAETIVRRIEVGPSEANLWLLAHAEMGGAVRTEAGSQVLMIQRTDDVLLSVATASAPATWTIVEGLFSYDTLVNGEERGESLQEKLEVSGHQTRAYVAIPSHRKPITLEVATVICRDLNEASALIPKLTQRDARLSDSTELQDARAGGEQDGNAIYEGDASFPKRLSGDESYRIEHFPLPKEINLMVTGMDWLSQDQLAVCTWAGDIHVVEQARGPVSAARYRRFARGLNEPLGLTVLEGHVYVVQKHELTRLSDTDGDGEADVFETINDDWGYTGNYHAFAFGPVVDKHKNFYAFLCGQRGRWDVPYVGWCVRISPDGSKLEGIASGLRAPNGFGTYGPSDDLFVADNQGNWVGASKLSHIQPGKFYGFPSGYPAPEAAYKNPRDPEPPAIWFPKKLSPSTSGFVTIESERFGPFRGQMLAGDFQNAVVMRVYLEKVNGEWQGAVWPFARGFLSGVNRLSFDVDGRLYVGGLRNTAWAATAPKDYSLDRVSFTGKAPFEIQEARARPDGFELLFTEPVDPETASDPDGFDVVQFRYHYHREYGSPEFDHEGNKDSSTAITVKAAKVSEDRRRVRLVLEGWKPGYVTLVRVLDITNASGERLHQEAFYYTLNRIPGESLR